MNIAVRAAAIWFLTLMTALCNAQPSGVTVTLSPDGQTPSAVVSTMSMTVGDWTVKPVYKFAETGPRVVGMLVFETPAAEAGSNLLAVWYERPADDCSPWVSRTWLGGKPWDAVVSLKAALGIPDIQDVCWEIEQATNIGAEEKNYTQGFASDDPIGELVNQLSNRDEVVVFLKSAGYPVADIPFDKGIETFSQVWLRNAANFFDATIGQNLEDERLVSAVALFDHPPVLVDPDGLCNEIVVWACGVARHYWDCHCVPRDIEGEWVPDGDLCGCRNSAPYCVASGTITPDVHGEAKVPTPWGFFTLKGGVSATINYCTCVTRRICHGHARRTITHVHEDCSQTYETVYCDDMEFTKFFPAQTDGLASCTSAGRPPGCPSETRDCGLETPTP